MNVKIGKKTKIFSAFMALTVLSGLIQQVSSYGFPQTNAQTITNGETSDLWQSTDTVGFYTIDCSNGDNLDIEYYVIATDGLTIILYDPGGSQVASDYQASTLMVSISHVCTQNGFYDIEIGRDTSGATNNIRVLVSGATPSSGGNIPGFNPLLMFFLVIGITSLFTYKFFKKNMKKHGY